MRFALLVLLSCLACAKRLPHRVANRTIHKLTADKIAQLHELERAIYLAQVNEQDMRAQRARYQQLAASELQVAAIAKAGACQPGELEIVLEDSSQSSYAKAAAARRDLLKLYDSYLKTRLERQQDLIVLLQCKFETRKALFAKLNNLDVAEKIKLDNFEQQQATWQKKVSGYEAELTKQRNAIVKAVAAWEAAFDAFNALTVKYTLATDWDKKPLWEMWQ